MADWEKILAEKLKNYEKSLPEAGLSGLTEARRAKGKRPERHRVPPLVWIAVPALAAVAVFLIDMTGSDGDPGIRPSPDQQFLAQTIVIDDVEEPSVAEESATAGNAVPSIPIGKPATAGNAVPSIPAEKPAETQEERSGKVAEEVKGTVSEAEDKECRSPFIPAEAAVVKTVRINPGRAATGALAGGASIVLASLLANKVRTSESFVWSAAGNVPDSPAYISSIISAFDSEPAGIEPETGKEYYYYNVNLTHNVPLKTGVSLRIPLNEKLSLTTGLEYSLYSSTFRYSPEFTGQQKVQYLGIPLKLDWTLFGNRWVDIYLGAGASVDLCTGAYLENKTSRQNLTRDGLAFSLLGAAGLQFNITDHLGLFLEPGISWTAGSPDRVLMTYRTVHPVIFNLSSGIRFTL